MRILRFAVLLSGLAALAGCGGKYHSVTGQVVMDGEPLASAMVQFVPDEGGGQKPASGMSDAQGHFRMGTDKPGDGVAPGKYKVIVSMVDQQGERTPTMAETMNAIHAKKSDMSGKEAGRAAQGQFAKEAKEAKARPKLAHTPAVYMDMSKTPLRAEVPARREYKFELSKSAK